MLMHPQRQPLTSLRDCKKLSEVRVQGNAARSQHRSCASRTVNTAQVLEADLEARIESNYNASTASRSQQSHLQSPATGREMGSRVHIPQHKVLTTSMIAQATNKNVEKVHTACDTTAPYHSRQLAQPDW